MLELCSLDFLKKDFFETDILDRSGKILFRAGEKITQKVILYLYFKEIYVNKFASKKSKKEITLNKKKITFKKFTSFRHLMKNLNLTDNAEIFDEYLNFDELEAKNVAKYAKLIGKSLNLPQNELEELETAAYYHNIGRTKLKPSELKQENVKRIQAKHSHDILLNEKSLSPKIAEAALLYPSNYSAKEFGINSSNPQSVPFYHIISIANFYHNLEKKDIPKNKILHKMMQIGGNKFNIFILYKFINLIQNEPKNLEM